MNISTTEQFEIPGEMRAVAERSIERAKHAFDGYIRAAQNAGDAIEQRFEAGQVGAQEVGRKTLHCALRSAITAFEFAQKIVQAKSIGEFIRLLNDYLQSQMQILSEQVKDLGEVMSNAASDGVKSRKPGGFAS